MSGTKALEQMLCRFPDGVTINDVDEFYSTWMEPAQAELVELKQRAALVYEDGCANILAEFSAMRTENDKLRTDLGLIYSAVGAKTPTDTLVTIGKMQAALGEALKSMTEALTELNRPDGISASYVLETSIRKLKANPK
jgi:hypothetical protein